MDDGFDQRRPSDELGDEANALKRDSLFALAHRNWLITR